MNDQLPGNIAPKHSPLPPMTNPSARWHRIWVWPLVLLIFVLVFWWVFHSQSTHNTTSMGRGAFGGPVTVNPTTATKGDIGVYLTAIGVVTPVNTVSVVSQASGQVIGVHYREGQLVPKGAPLIDIDPRTYAASLQQAEGTLERDTHILEQAKMDLQRYQAALARNAISKQQVEDQEKLVLQEQGTVKLDQGTVDLARVQLSYCHIVAPISGRVGLRLVDPGNVVTAGGGTTLAVITQVQPITVVFTISEDNLPRVMDALRKKRSLEVQALDRAQMKLLAKGKLLTTDNLIDTTTGTVKLRAAFNNKNGELFPNQFVNTRLLVDTIRDTTLVESSAIQHNGTQAYVWVLVNGKAQMRNITTGVTENGLTQVTGLEPGEVVADSSFEKLHPDAEVRLVEHPAAGASGDRTQHKSGEKKPQ